MCDCATNIIHHLLPRQMPRAHDFPVLHLEVQWETRSQTCHLGYSSRMLILHLPLLLPGKLSWRVSDIAQVPHIFHFVETCFPQIKKLRTACKQCLHSSITECWPTSFAKLAEMSIVMYCPSFTWIVHLEVLGCFSVVYGPEWCSTQRGLVQSGQVRSAPCQSWTVIQARL